MRKGELLELRLYKILSDLLAKGELGLDPRRCAIFHQKAYYSRERNNTIKVDVSIEFYPVDSSTDPIIIWVWECKDYSGSIPIGEIEKFNAVLEQIGAAKTKGTIISSEGILDRSAIAYARAKGIGVARLMPDDKIESSSACNLWPMYVLIPLVVLLTYWLGDWLEDWILFVMAVFLLCIVSWIVSWRVNSPDSEWRKEDVLQALTQGDFVSNEKEFYGLTSNWRAFFTPADFFRSEVADLVNH